MIHSLVKFFAREAFRNLMINIYKKFSNFIYENLLFILFHFKRTDIIDTKTLSY